MRVTVSPIMNRSAKFVVSHNEVKFTNASMQLPIKRTDTDHIVKYDWFPLSQIKYRDLGLDYEVEIPVWLLKKKIKPGFTVGN